MNYQEYLQKSRKNDFGDLNINSVKIEEKNEKRLSPEDALAHVYFPDNDNDIEASVWSLLAQHPQAIKYANPRFRQDLSLALQGLIISSGKSYEYLSLDLKRNSQLALCAFKFDYEQVKSVPQELFNDEFCFELLKHLKYFTLLGSTPVPKSIIKEPEALMQKMLLIEAKISNIILSSAEFEKIEKYIAQKR